MKRMKKLFAAAARRTRSRAGESLTETLVALLIAAIAITMLASMIMTSTEMIHRSKNDFDAYYAQNNILAEHPADGGTGAQATLSSGAGDTAQTIELQNGASTVAVKVYENSEAPDKTPVVSYVKTGS